VRVGILGGTFNPPHVGHLVCAQEAYLRLGLDRVLLIPARVPPHKPVPDEPGPEHRLRLCQAAVEGDHDRLAVAELELARQGPSYTVDTLDELRSKAPEDELWLIVGGDIAAGLPEWHQAERVLELATLAVAQRPGTERTTIDAALSELPGGERAQFFEMPEIGISSSMVRSRIRAGLPVKYLVPDAVSGYIDRHGLYRSSPSDDA
jgi:nicotinate-nucleotide adenylyltransferase